MTKKVKRRVLKGEKLIWMLIFVLLVATPLVQVLTKAELSESNLELEKLKKNITAQESLNESLTMKINELASLDNIEAIAEDNGLSYNNDNIKVIDSNN